MIRHTLFAGLLIVTGAIGIAADRQPGPVADFKLPDVTGGVTLDQALRTAPEPEPWKPGVRREKVRSATSSGVYAKAAPGVVVIQANGGHGTGIIVDDEGWILTNQHVVERVGVDSKTGSQAVRCFLGRLEDGVMTLDETPRFARLHKIDAAKDLALLKLADVDGGITSIPLAEKGARAGDDCYAIGHPAAGMLWTLRSGEIAGIGKWPQDMIQTVMARLAASTEQQAQLQKNLESAPVRKVLLSSCGINPGDSGGPLVNAQGELVGVTFAIPKSDANSGVSLDKFSYHIHLDDVRAFLADRPAEPILYIPDVWPAGTVSGWADRDGDGKVDGWMFGAKAGGPLTGVVMDLDQNSGKAFAPGKTVDIGLKHEWDFEFAFHRLPLLRSFYDRDNDGVVDYALTDADGDEIADLALERKDGDWTSVSLGETKQPIFDPQLFESPVLQERMATLLKPKAAAEPAPTAAASE